jgi:hypothetical protein
MNDVDQKKGATKEFKIGLENLDNTGIKTITRLNG